RRRQRLVRQREAELLVEVEVGAADLQRVRKDDHDELRAKRRAPIANRGQQLSDLVHARRFSGVRTRMLSARLFLSRAASCRTNGFLGTASASAPRAWSLFVHITRHNCRRGRRYSYT